MAEAEKKKAEAHAEHQRKALICNKAESEVRLVFAELFFFTFWLKRKIGNFYVKVKVFKT